jgi:hypothetical protein
MMDGNRLPNTPLDLGIDEESCMRQCDQADAVAEQIRSSTNRMSELVNEAYKAGFDEAWSLCQTEPATHGEAAIATFMLVSVLAGLFFAGFAAGLIFCGF